MDQQKSAVPATIFTPEQTKENDTSRLRNAVNRSTPAKQQHNTDMSVSESTSESYSAVHLAAISSANTAVNTPAKIPEAASEKLVTLEIRTAKTRKDLAYREPKLHNETFTRWTQVPELQNKQSLEVMLDQYRDVKLAAYVLNCSRHMVYAAMDYHGVTFPRVYSSKRTKQQLGLQSTLSPGIKERQNRS